LIDVDVPLEEEQQYMTPKQLKIARVHNRMKRNTLREAAFNNTTQISNIFESNTDLATMRKPFNKVFMKTWEKAFGEYVKGDWESSLATFEQFLVLKEGDKPATLIIDFMKENSM